MNGSDNQFSPRPILKVLYILTLYKVRSGVRGVNVVVVSVVLTVALTDGGTFTKATSNQLILIRAVIILFPKPFQWNSLDLMGMSSQRTAFFVPWMAPPVGQCFKRDRPRTPAVPGPAAFRTAAHHQRPPSSPSSHFIPETLQKLPTDHQKGPFHYTKKKQKKSTRTSSLRRGSGWSRANRGQVLELLHGAPAGPAAAR